MSETISNNLPTNSRDGLKKIAIFGVFFFAAVGVAHLYKLFWVDPISPDAKILVVARDFLNFWMYGRAALTPDPSRFYDFDLYNRELSLVFGLEDMGVAWSYPPSIMLVAAPFGELNYVYALTCWTLLGIAIFIAVLKQHVTDWRLLIPLVFSPAAALCLMGGQTSFMTTAILIGVFTSLDRKPLLAGFLIGLLTLKPQIGIFFPVLLAASGRWRVFFAATITALAITGITTALFGTQVWLDYIVKGLPVQNLVLLDPNMLNAPYMPTIFMNMRTAGASYEFAMAVQAGFSAVALGVVFWAYRFHKNANPLFLAALFLACSVFGSPYLLTYDLLPLTVAVVLLLASGKLDLLGQRLALVVYWLPALQMAFGFLRLPGAALVTVAFAAYVVMQLRHRTDRAFAAGAPSAA